MCVHASVLNFFVVYNPRGGAADWGTALQAGNVAGSIPDGVIKNFHGHNPSGNTVILGSI